MTLLERDRRFAIPVLSGIVYAPKLEILNSLGEAARAREGSRNRTLRWNLAGAEPALDARRIVGAVYFDRRQLRRFARGLRQIHGEAPLARSSLYLAWSDCRHDIGLIHCYCGRHVDELRCGRAREYRYRAGVLSR